MTWIIRCSVSGGVTGHRESILKSNGVVRRFATREEANREAVRLNEERNGFYAKAVFRYWEEEEL